MKLICLPYAGASSYFYAPWEKIDNNKLHIKAYELPGHGNRYQETLFEHINDVLKELLLYVNQINDEDYALFGHSMGSLIAFSLAQEIKRNKLKGPSHIFISGCSAPNHTEKSNKIWTLSDEEFMKSMMKYDSKIKNIINYEELLHIVLAILRADFKIIDSFLMDYNILVDCNITVFYGNKDKSIQGEIKEWNQYTNQQCDMVEFNGGHFFILDYMDEIFDHISCVLCCK